VQADVDRVLSSDNDLVACGLLMNWLEQLGFDLFRCGMYRVVLRERTSEPIYLFRGDVLPREWAGHIGQGLAAESTLRRGRYRLGTVDIADEDSRSPIYVIITFENLERYRDGQSRGFNAIYRKQNEGRRSAVVRGPGIRGNFAGNRSCGGR
jgi:hypothetical protein